MHKHEAAIVIPFYKAQCSAYESIALTQCFKVLKNYPVFFVKPRSLTLPSNIPSEKFEVISFDDDYFNNIHGYNRLMFAHEFYKSFAAYKFILIHQPDAFVFSDQLSYWCGQGYDYAGAPWLGKKVYRHYFSWLNARIRNYLAVRYNAKEKDGMPKIGKQMENRVGNGGFSLRRVSLFTGYCIRFKPAIDKYVAMQHPWFNEDIFWSIEINRKKKYLKLPGLKKGLKFAFETYPETALEKNGGKLPFGCHAWDKNLDFWRPVFKHYGYNI